jgi:flagellar basal body rod protein FlgG
MAHNPRQEGSMRGLQGWALGVVLWVSACQASPSGVDAQAFSRPTDDATLRLTGNPLDLALPVPAAQTGAPYPFNQLVISFIELRSPAGDRLYARGGSFQLNARREIVHAATGYPLATPITVPNDAVEILIRVDGAVTVRRQLETDYEERGVVTVVRFPDPTRLAPLGIGLFKATSAAGLAIAGRPATGGQNELKQGVLLP